MVEPSRFYELCEAMLFWDPRGGRGARSTGGLHGARSGGAFSQAEGLQDVIDELLSSGFHRAALPYLADRSIWECLHPGRRSDRRPTHIPKPSELPRGPFSASCLPAQSPPSELLRLRRTACPNHW